MDIRLIEKSDSSGAIDSLFNLSYCQVDKGNFSMENKRKLLFSLYSIRCLFDNWDYICPPEVLLKYGCSFLLNSDLHPDFEKNKSIFAQAKMQSQAVVLPLQGILTTYFKQKLLKFDAGSQLYFYFCGTGCIDKQFAQYPTKLQMEEAIKMLLRLNKQKDKPKKIKLLKNLKFKKQSLSDGLLFSRSLAKLKAFWFLMYPFLFKDAPNFDKAHKYFLSALNKISIFKEAVKNEYFFDMWQEIAQKTKQNQFFAKWYFDFYNWLKSGCGNCMDCDGKDVCLNFLDNSKISKSEEISFSHTVKPFYNFKNGSKLKDFDNFDKEVKQNDLLKDFKTTKNNKNVDSAQIDLIGDEKFLKQLCEFLNTQAFSGTAVISTGQLKQVLLKSQRNVKLIKLLENARQSIYNAVNLGDTHNPGDTHKLDNTQQSLIKPNADDTKVDFAACGMQKSEVAQNGVQNELPNSKIPKREQQLYGGEALASQAYFLALNFLILGQKHKAIQCLNISLSFLPLFKPASSLLDCIDEFDF